MEYLRAEHKKKKAALIKQHENKIYNLHCYYDEEITELHKQFEETKNKYENALKKLETECTQLTQERDEANKESLKATKRNQYLNDRLQEYEPYREKYRNAKIIAQKLRNELIQASEEHSNSTVAFLRAQRLSALEEASQFTRKYSHADEMEEKVDQEVQTDPIVVEPKEEKIEPPILEQPLSEISRAQTIEVKGTNLIEKPEVQIPTVISNKNFKDIGINTDAIEDSHSIESEDSQEEEEIKIVQPPTNSELNQSIESKPEKNPRKNSNKPLPKKNKEKKKPSKKLDKSKFFQKDSTLIPPSIKPTRPLTPAVYPNRQRPENNVNIFFKVLRSNKVFLFFVQGKRRSY